MPGLKPSDWLLIAVWHVISFQVADIHAEPLRIARKFMLLAYKLRVANHPDGLSTAASTRTQLDHLKLGRELSTIPCGAKKKPVQLPPSSQPHTSA